MKIIKISDKNNNILRFDTNARLEVFVSQWDIEYHKKYKFIISQNISDEEKIKQLKEIASEIAYEKKSDLTRAIFNEGLGINITAESLSSDTIDFERMPWNDMLHPEVEE